MSISRARGGAVLDLDEEVLGFLADPGARLLHVDRQPLLARDRDRPRRHGTLDEEGDLVGQADPDQRAARAFGAVLERWRDPPRECEEPQAVDGGARQGAQLLVEHHPHAFAALGEPEEALLDAVSRLLEQERLDAELDALRLVRTRLDVRTAAALDVDGRDLAVLDLDEIASGDEAQAVGAELQRTDGEGRGFGVELLGVRDRAGWSVAPPVADAAFDRVGRVGPLLLDPHQVGEPRTVDELVDHPRRQGRHVVGQGWRRKRQFGLVDHVRSSGPGPRKPT